MKSKPKAKRTYSPESKERMRVAALARYDAGAEQIHERVRAMMKTIQIEMAGNGGIYPNNKGAVSMAEVARRSEINPTTFYKDRYRELGKEVDGWMITLKEGSVIGRVRVRKELGTRVQEWKELYEDLLATHRLSETDLAHTQELLKEALKENEQLRSRLSEQAALKIVPIRPNKGD